MVRIGTFITIFASSRWFSTANVKALSREITEKLRSIESGSSAKRFKNSAKNHFHMEK